MILIDTDICVEILKRNERVISARERRDEAIAVCFMSVAQLYYASARSTAPERNDSLIEEFLLTVEIIHSDIGISKRFGQLKARLRTQGVSLPDADVFIAAVAYEKADLLVTGNAGHFQRFPNLNVENWIR